jgi:phosphoribosylformylglycinamidine cyclo-ligase
LSRYQELGVDVKKPGIERFNEFIDNLYPGAFCVIQRDPANPEMGMVLHTDSAGSKPIQAYLTYRETGNASIFGGLAQDSLAMNINDVLCVGADPVSFVDYIAFNTIIIDRAKMLVAIADGFNKCKKTLREEGVPIGFAGGETADLPDLLRTLDVCVTMFARIQLDKVVSGKEIKPGDVIVGVRSGGKIRYERGINSGIMSNGHTLARASLLTPTYLEKYPEISHPSRGRYVGKYTIEDYLEELGMTIGEALLSPTRLYAPLAAEVLRKIDNKVHGMVHNTGGGQTKCLRIGHNIRYVKNSLPEPDPIFNLIQREAEVEWREMYQDFNTGVGFEFIVDPSVVDEVLSVVEKFGAETQVIGHCEKGHEKNSLVHSSMHGRFLYV